MPIWNKFAWTAFFYKVIGGDSAYQKLFGQPDLLDAIRCHPDTLQPQVIRDRLLTWIIHKYGRGYHEASSVAFVRGFRFVEWLLARFLEGPSGFAVRESSREWILPRFLKI